MIDKDELISFSKLNGLRPNQQEKHYIQTLVLTALSEEPLIFKGGTYLWFFHGLPRFSEDLDFTQTGKLPQELATKVSQTLRMFGVENEVKMITDDECGFSFRLGAKGPLYTSEVSMCYVYVEISRRERVVGAPLSLKLDFPPYKLPTKIVRGFSLNEIGAEKVRAILTRDKARDLYDLYFLITEKKIAFDLSLVNEKLSYYRQTFSADAFNKKLKEKQIIWKSELEQLVFDELPKIENVLESISKWQKPA